MRQLEDALRDEHALSSETRHPLLTDELLQIKRPLERDPKHDIPLAGAPNMIDTTPETSEEAKEVLDAVGSLYVTPSILWLVNC